MFAAVVSVVSAVVAQSFQVSPRRVLSRRPLRSAAVEYESVELASGVPLRGTLYRCGPCDDKGNAALAAVTFDGEAAKAIARVRFVRSRNFLTQTTERKQKEREGRRAVGCFYWREMLFAVQEDGLPYQMDPVSLGTQKLSELGAQIEDRFYPKPKMGTDVLINLEVTKESFPFVPATSILFREFNLQFREENKVDRVRMQLDKGEDLTDWGFTRSKYVVATTNKGKKTQGKTQGKTRVTRRLGSPSSKNEARCYDLSLKTVVACFDDDDQGGVVVDGIDDQGHLRRFLLREKESSSAVVEVSDFYEEEDRNKRVDFAVASSSGVLYAVRGNELAKISPLGGGKRELVRYAHPDASAEMGIPTIVGDTVVTLITSKGVTAVATLSAETLALLGEVALPYPLPRDLAGPFVPALAPTLDDVRAAETLMRLYAKKSSQWNEMDGGFSGLGFKQILFPKGVSGG